MRSSNKKYGYTGHALILTGRKGAKILEQIMNGPTIPYEKLKKESDACIKRIIERRTKCNEEK